MYKQHGNAREAITLEGSPFLKAIQKVYGRAPFSDALLFHVTTIFNQLEERLGFNPNDISANQDYFLLLRDIPACITERAEHLDKRETSFL